MSLEAVFRGELEQLEKQVAADPSKKQQLQGMIDIRRQRISEAESRRKGEQEIARQKAANQRELVETDTLAGMAFAREKLGMGEGSLGRLDTSRLEDLSQGMSAEELQASRDKALENINRSTQTQNRQLQALQAQQGIRGATAGAQQLSILQGGEDRKADFERDLFLEDRNARIQGIKDLQQVQQFNLAQAAQEKYDIAKSGLTFAQMGISQAAGEKAQQANLAAANAQSGGK